MCDVPQKEQGSAFPHSSMVLKIKVHSVIFCLCCDDLYWQLVTWMHLHAKANVFCYLYLGVGDIYRYSAIILSTSITIWVLFLLWLCQCFLQCWISSTMIKETIFYPNYDCEFAIWIECGVKRKWTAKWYWNCELHTKTNIQWGIARFTNKWLKLKKQTNKTHIFNSYHFVCL